MEQEKTAAPGQGTPAPPPATGAKAKKKRRFYRHINVNEGQPSFAAGLNIYKVLWVFIIGCFLGVVWETFYTYWREGEWMRRSGMLYGPFNQVYGFGAVLFTVLLYRFRHKNAMVIFLASFGLGLAFEYLCSWAQELMFGSVSWEYSEMAMNIGGRTNLFYGVGWGIMGFLFLKHFWPFMSEMIERIPNKIGKPLTVLVMLLLAADLLLSGMAVFRQRLRLEGVAANGPVSQWLDKTYPDEVMAEKYPSMKFVSQREAEAPAGEAATPAGAPEPEGTGGAAGAQGAVPVISQTAAAPGIQYTGRWIQSG